MLFRSELRPDLAAHLTRALTERPDIGIFYGDDAVVDGAGQVRSVHCKPAFNPALLMADDYIGFPLLIRALLAEQHRIGFRPSYVKTHSNAYRQVARGEAAAAGGIRSTLEREPPDLRSRLRILFETPGFASHPLAAHPSLAPKLRAQVVKAFSDLHASEEGRKQLAAILFSDPVPADYQRDYGSLQKLGLDRHVVRGD